MKYYLAIIATFGLVFLWVIAKQLTIANEMNSFQTLINDQWADVCGE